MDLQKVARENGKADAKRRLGLADYALPALVAAGTAAGSYKLLRKKKLSDNPALRRLQEQIGDKGIEIATHQPTGSALGRLARRFHFGAPDISDTVDAAARAGKVYETPNVVLHHSAGSVQPIKTPLSINDPRGIYEYFDNKNAFGQLMQNNAPANTVPQTRGLGEIIDSVDPRHHERAWDELKRRLNEQHPEGWILKPSEGSLGDVSQFPQRDFPHNHPAVRDALEHPRAFIAQEKIPIQSEYRVHTVNGVPVTATHRRAPEGGFRDMWNNLSNRLGIGQGNFAHVPVRGDERKALDEFINTVHAPFQASPEFYGENPMHVAYDVARLPDGSFRLIEGNPTPGTFMNPITSRKVQEAMTGRMHQDFAAGLAGLTGLGAAGATYAGMQQARE